MAMMDGLFVDVKIVIGEARMPLSEVLQLGRGAVIMLDGANSGFEYSDSDPIDAPLRVEANGKAIANAQVVLRGEDVAVELSAL